MATVINELSYGGAPVKIREDLTAAHARAWRRLAAPGVWHDGATRIAIAAETRNAPSCALCAERKDALSPYGVEGKHDSLGDLPEDVVEVIHRVATDPGRLMEPWYQGLLADGMADTDYVETIAVLVTVVSIDTFARSIGMDPPPLPDPVAGEPARHRPAGAKQASAWVPWVSSEDRTEREIDEGLYAGGGPPFVSYIRRALSLVPVEAVGFFDLVENQYLPGREMRNFGEEYRAITHAQIELIAGRMSALNQCFY